MLGIIILGISDFPLNCCYENSCCCHFPRPLPWPSPFAVIVSNDSWCLCCSLRCSRVFLCDVVEVLDSYIYAGKMRWMSLVSSHYNLYPSPLRRCSLAWSPRPLPFLGSSILWGQAHVANLWRFVTDGLLVFGKSYCHASMVQVNVLSGFAVFGWFDHTRSNSTAETTLQFLNADSKMCLNLLVR